MQALSLILNARIANMAAVALSRQSVTMIDIPTTSTASSTGYAIATDIADGFLAIGGIGCSLVSAQIVTTCSMKYRQRTLVTVEKG